MNLIIMNLQPIHAIQVKFNLKLPEDGRERCQKISSVFHER